MRDGSNVRQELAAVNYVSVWSVCVCLCVLLLSYMYEGDLYVHVYIHCAATASQTQPEDQNEISETFHSTKCTLKTSLRTRFQIRNEYTHLLKSVPNGSVKCKL